MMSNYTPGPWEVRQTFYGETYIEGKDGDFVCAFPEPNKKDVVIIAAAPEMVKLLNEAIRAIWGLGVYLYDAEKWELTDRIDALLHSIEGEGGKNIAGA